MSRMSRTQAATTGLLVPAALALAMSADTSYRFLGTALQITNETERMVLCGVAEAAIVALTVYAWATRTKGPAYLAYAAVLVQAIPAFQVSGGVGGPVRVVLGPVLLAVLLHLLLGLELRMSGEKSGGLLASAMRELRERLTASLGIGRRGADSAAIARSRAADRAVNLADAVAAAKWGRTRTRRAAKLAAAMDAARHGLSPAEAAEAEAAIVTRVVRRKSVTSLAEIEARHDWAVSLVSRDTGHDTVPAAASRDTASVVPHDTVPAAASRDTASVVPQDTVPAAASRDTGHDVVPVPVVPAVVSRTRATVPATVSRPRPTVRISLDKTPEEISAERDMSRDEGQPSAGVSEAGRGKEPVVVPAARDNAVDVPEDMLGNLSSIVRYLMETGHSRDEARAIVPTLPGHEDVKPDSLRKALQRAEKALAAGS